MREHAIEYGRPTSAPSLARAQHFVQRRALRYFRTHDLLDEADTIGILTLQGSGGFSIDASVHLQGDDRADIKRLLCSDIARVRPLPSTRSMLPAGIASLAASKGRLVYRLARPAQDGRTELRLSPLQLLERLARFIPPPRMHRHRYHGALAPNAKLRAAVVAIGAHVPTRRSARRQGTVSSNDETVDGPRLWCLTTHLVHP